MLYLTGGVVYSCRIGAQKVERISPMDNVFSFIPTNSGNLYAAGELFNCSISLDNVHLLDKVSYYSVDLEKDHFVATVDGTLFQIPMAKLRGFCSKAIKEKAENTADLLPYMTEYDLYGTYDTVELLRLNDENRICEHCESEEPHTHREESLSEAELKDAGVCATVPLSNVGKMIMHQSNSLTGYTWRPKADVRKYNSLNSLSSEYFKKNVPVTGIPYARDGVFDNFNSNLSRYMKYIVYGYSLNITEEWTTLGMSFDMFNDWVNNSSSKFYGPAANIAPLYGTDCSGFVSYCWGVKAKLGTSMFGGGYNGTYYCTKLTGANTSQLLGMLQVGDAFVKSGDHVILISSITVNSTGAVTHLEVTEETPPITRTKPWTAAGFINEYINKGYLAYRPKTYKVTFVDNTASSTPAPMYVIANVPYNAGNGLPVQSANGCQFLGWYTAASGGVKVTNNDCSGMSARTLYARYRHTGNVSPTSYSAYDCIVPQSVRLIEREER